MLNILQAASLAGLPAWAFWLIILIAATIIELTTINLVSIWFAAAALISLALDLLQLNLTVQIIVFILVSAIGFAIFIFLVRPHFSGAGKSIIATNADRILGQEGIVTERIAPLEGKGQVQVLGQIWSARSKDSSIIASGSLVIVRDIAGVHAIVEQVDDQNGIV